MKKIALTFLLLFSVFCRAADKLNPDEYTTTIHVTSSHVEVSTSVDYQCVDAMIDGKKYVLRGGWMRKNFPLLALGDYKGKLVRDEHPTTYLSSRAYQLLLPDGKTMTFTVIGFSE